MLQVPGVRAQQDGAWRVKGRFGARGTSAMQREPTAASGGFLAVQFNTFLHSTYADVCSTLICE
jgi:hypothetical protein